VVVGCGDGSVVIGGNERPQAAAIIVKTNNHAGNSICFSFRLVLENPLVRWLILLRPSKDACLFASMPIIAEGEKGGNDGNGRDCLHWYVLSIAISAVNLQYKTAEFILDQVILPFLNGERQ
jgi:hypothetical protein